MKLNETSIAGMINDDDVCVMILDRLTVFQIQTYHPRLICHPAQ